MPRDQETSIEHDPATSDDPLFRQPDDQRGDQSVRGQNDPLRDPLDADDEADASHTPIGDELAAGRHADGDSEVSDGPAGTRSDTPGEWVAGSKGPGYDPARDGAVVPDQPGQPAVESTDPVTGDPVASNARGTTDPDAAETQAPGTLGNPDVPESPDALRTSDTPGASDDALRTSDTPGTSDTATVPAETSDLRTTRDPEVAPDSAFTRDSGTPADPRATTTEATSTSATSGATADTDVPETATGPAGATAATATTTPAAPVPGAPGTGSTTGVQAASAALLTNGSELHDDWARIQQAFVDDPRGSVSQAADLVSQVANSLVNAVQERESTLRGAWDKQGDQGADTENLRNALRDYRAFFELLIRV